MLSRVIPFRKNADLVGWRPDELAECYRVVGLLARSGLPISIDSGLTDEDEPWAIVLREDTGDVLLHMARLDGAFVVVSAAGTVAQRGESLRAVLDAAVQTGGLAVLTCHSAAADCEILRLHPATLIAAFIAAAWVHTQTSQAELLDASARRDEGGGFSRTTDEAARLAGFAALPSSAALATAATSFAAVAAVLHASHTDPILEVTLDDFVQAALEFVAEAPVIATSVLAAPIIIAPIEFANLELRQDGPLISLAAIDGSASPPSQAQLNDAPILIRLEASALLAPIPMISASAGDIPRFLLQQQSSTQSLGLDWDSPDAHFLAIGAVNTADFASVEPTGPLLVAISSSSPSAEGTALTARPAAPAYFAVVAESPLVVRTTLPVTMHETSLHSAHSWDVRGAFFKNAAQILHLDRVVAPIGAEVSVSPDKNSEGAPATLWAKPVPASVSADTSSALPNAASSAVSPAPPTQGASVPQAATSNSDVSGASPPLIAVVQPAPPSNAQILLEFTNRTEDVVRVDRGVLSGSLTGHLETGDARKVVVFDAPWLQIKSFMLMPGVMMMEDDILGATNRTGVEIKGRPVLLDLGDGLTLTLLGVIDLGLA